MALFDYTTSDFRMRLIALNGRASREFTRGAEEAVRMARQSAQSLGDSPAQRRLIEENEDVLARWRRHDRGRRG